MLKSTVCIYMYNCIRKCILCKYISVCENVSETCIKTCTDMYAHRSVNISVCIEGENFCQELVRRYTNTCQLDVYKIRVYAKRQR